MSFRLAAFLTVGVLFAGACGSARAAGPQESYLDAAKRKASDLVAAMPSISLPELPSMSVPDVSSMKDAVLRQFTAFTDDIGTTLPALDAMGYEVTSFRVHWSLSPKAHLRLRSKTAGDVARIDNTLASAPAKGLVATAILTSAAEAKRIQRSLHMGTAIIDVDFDVPPKVKMSFLPTRTADSKASDEAEVVCPTMSEDR